MILKELREEENEESHRENETSLFLESDMNIQRVKTDLQSKDLREIYLSIIKEFNNQIQQNQKRLVELFNNLELKLYKNFKTENEELIKLFKLPKEIIEKIEYTAMSKIDEELNYKLKEAEIQLKEENIENNNNNYYFDLIYQNKFNLDLSCSTNIEACRNVIKLLIKNKHRIDSFINKHLLPLCPLLEEKYNDFFHTKENEVELFKNSQLSNFSLAAEDKLNKNLYSLKSFNYDKDHLLKLNLENKIQVFKLFFNVKSNKDKINTINNRTKQVHSLTANNPFYKRFLLVFEKTSDLINFLFEDLDKTVKRFIEDFIRLKNSIITFQSEISDYFLNIIKIWKRDEFLNFLKNRFEPIIREIKMI